MSITIDLEPELEAALTREAAYMKMSLPDYILRALAVGRKPDPMPKTGAEVLAYWDSLGILGNRPDIVDPLAYARELRERAETRQRG